MKKCGEQREERTKRLCCSNSMLSEQGSWGLVNDKMAIHSLMRMFADVDETAVQATVSASATLMIFSLSLPAMLMPAPRKGASGGSNIPAVRRG